MSDATNSTSTNTTTTTTTTTSDAAALGERLPFFLLDNVIKGFGRGSKQLGIPTANLPTSNYAGMLESLPTGVYLGWAQVHTSDAAQVHPMAMSIGWNPFFKNEQKTIEVHIIHEYDADFYDAELRAIVCEYIRPERNFGSLDELIAAIKHDIDLAKTRTIDVAAYRALKEHAFFADASASIDLVQLNAKALAAAAAAAAATAAAATQPEAVVDLNPNRKTTKLTASSSSPQPSGGALTCSYCSARQRVATDRYYVVRSDADRTMCRSCFEHYVKAPSLSSASMVMVGTVQYVFVLQLPAQCSVCANKQTVSRPGVKYIDTQVTGVVAGHAVGTSLWMCGKCFCTQLKLPDNTAIPQRESAYASISDADYERALAAHPRTGGSGHATAPNSAAPAAPEAQLVEADGHYSIVPDSAFLPAEQSGVYGGIGEIAAAMTVPERQNALPASPAYDMVARPPAYDLVAAPAHVSGVIVSEREAMQRGYGRVPDEPSNRLPNPADPPYHAAPPQQLQLLQQQQQQVLQLPARPHGASNQLPTRAPLPQAARVTSPQMPRTSSSQFRQQLVQQPAAPLQRQATPQRSLPGVPSPTVTRSLPGVPARGAASPSAARRAEGHYDSLSLLPASHYDDVEAQPEIACVDPQLLKQVWYHGSITREQAWAMLTDQAPMTFLVRDSANNDGFVFVINKGGNQFHNVLAARQPDGSFKLGSAPQAYKTLEEIIAAYRTSTGQFRLEHEFPRPPS